MKKAIYAGLVLGIVFVSGTIFAEEFPPTIQTLEKEAPVTEKTEQKSPETLIKRVVISEDGTITIYFEASGDITISLPKINEEEKRNEKEEDKILSHFYKIWDSRGADRDELTEEELREADATMRAYFDELWKQNPSEWSIPYNQIAEMGNRYVMPLEKLLLRYDDEKILLEFYDHYLRITEGMRYFTRTEDIPTLDDQQRVIRNITALLYADMGSEQSKKLNRFLGFDTRKIFSVVNPETYAFFLEAERNPSDNE